MLRCKECYLYVSQIIKHQFSIACGDFQGVTSQPSVVCHSPCKKSLLSATRVKGHAYVYYIHHRWQFVLFVCRNKVVPWMCSQWVVWERYQQPNGECSWDICRHLIWDYIFVGASFVVMRSGWVQDCCFFFVRLYLSIICFSFYVSGYRLTHCPADCFCYWAQL